MSHTWNEFNKELQDRVSDPGMRYILGLIYERVLDLGKQQTQCGEVMLGMAQTLSSMVTLSELQDRAVQDLAKALRGERDGVELKSVPLTND